MPAEDRDTHLEWPVYRIVDLSTGATILEGLDPGAVEAIRAFEVERSGGRPDHCWLSTDAVAHYREPDLLVRLRDYIARHGGFIDADRDRRLVMVGSTRDTPAARGSSEPRTEWSPHGRAWLRCYAELNDFLPPVRRFTDVAVDFDVAPSVKDLIERVGVPHTEVDLVIVDGESVDFSYRVRDADRISVYPRFEAIDIGPILRVRPLPLREVRFVLDVHLGRLARYLRLTGFDADYSATRFDRELARVSAEEGRVLLTRDRGLLKRSAVSHGYAVRETRPRAQLVEVLRRFDLSGRVVPFTRCMECNSMLRAATSAEIAEQVPASVRARSRHYRACRGCGRVYWQGSHYASLSRIVDEARCSGRPDSA